MTPITGEEIAVLTGSELIGTGKLLVRHICTDTRRPDLPSDTLFVALKGPNHDGHRYIREAFALGIRSFIVSRVPDEFTGTEDAVFLVNANPLKALQELARNHRNQLSGTLIAVTGSNGKTIVKEWLAQVLSGFFRVSKSPKSYNSQLGVPLSVLSVNPGDEYAILEAGISRPGEMTSLHEVLNPDWGLFTTIGDAHQENFTGIDQKIREKLILFTECKKLFYCLDHHQIDQEIKKSGSSAELLAWSRYSDAKLRITEEIKSAHKTTVKAVFGGKNVNLILPFTDPASVENLIHIWLIILVMGLNPEQVQKEVLALEPVKMRLEQKEGINNCTLINDFYNSDLQAFKIALDILFQQTHQVKKTVILSDILQTGVPGPELYAGINRLVEGRGIDRIIGIGPAIHENRGCFTVPVQTWISTWDFISRFNPDEFRDEAILLKGARPFTFEAISRLLEARIHATTLEVRMEDVRHNLTVFRQGLKPGTGIMVMVKAFSYGSGGVEIARFLAHERVDYLGVAFADEGVEIRKAGIGIPVMVMNPDYRQSDILIDHNLEPEIFSWSGLQAFARAAREFGGTPAACHLKFDTGMHRLGFKPDEAALLGDFMAIHTEIFIRTAFSHLSASEDPAADDFTRLQISRFEEACETLSAHCQYPFKKHILNTSGIGRFPEARFDMVRLGIGLYGYNGTLEAGLKPIATLRTVISQVHDLPAGETVGYGRMTILNKPARVAVIPIGYADGIDRRLGNGNYRMMIKGEAVATIGNICMDMTLLDVTDTKAVEGDEVVVFSPENPVTAMAEILNTIPYEILTSIPARVKRIYLFE